MDTKIEVEIDENGFIKATAKGLTGPSCIDGVTSLLKDLAYIWDQNYTDDFNSHVIMKQGEMQKQKEIQKQHFDQ